VHRPVLEDPVRVPELRPLVAPQAEPSARLVLEVVRLVVEPDGAVPAARPALVRLDVDEVDERRRRRRGRSADEQRQE
jgi:hypothetical protein